MKSFDFIDNWNLDLTRLFRDPGDPGASCRQLKFETYSYMDLCNQLLIYTIATTTYQLSFYKLICTYLCMYST